MWVSAVVKGKKWRFQVPLKASKQRVSTGLLNFAETTSNYLYLLVYLFTDPSAFVLIFPTQVQSYLIQQLFLIHVSERCVSHIVMQVCDFPRRLTDRIPPGNPQPPKWVFKIRILKLHPLRCKGRWVLTGAKGIVARSHRYSTTWKSLIVTPSPCPLSSQSPSNPGARWYV